MIGNALSPEMVRRHAMEIIAYLEETSPVQKMVE